MEKFTPKPRAVQGDLAQLPAPLRPLTEIAHWVCWRFERKTTGGPGWTKRPICALTGRAASSKDPSTWSTYLEAVAYHKSGRADGIGFVLTPDLTYAAIDVDGCRDPNLKSLYEWGQDFLEQAALNDTYAEVTPSGEGIRLWGITQGDFHAHKPYPLGLEGFGEKRQIELYRRTNQYITITGLTISVAAQLGNIDQVFDWAPRWAAMHPRPKEAKSSNGSGATPGQGPVSEMSVQEIDRLVREGAAEGTRSELFHGICWHFAGYGYDIDEIADLVARQSG
jgi:primase-polymerase (primpol)-like protein